ncbi:DUF664 domain-containing protein [Streptomyces sp. NBC_00989]|uniref:mycothiol transferase n=1 Tax=Streptomyces sp. NBC_00989 TaxID=2903705 RepID=UPI00386D2F03
MAADERTKDILDFYTRARAAADEAIESLDIDATGTAFAFFDGVTVSLRWALIHMSRKSLGTRVTRTSCANPSTVSQEITTGADAQNLIDPAENSWGNS